MHARGAEFLRPENQPQAGNRLGDAFRPRSRTVLNLGTAILAIVWAFALGLAIPIGWWAVAPYRCPTCGSHLRRPVDDES
jgi:hypothetical protein